MVKSPKAKEQKQSKQPVGWYQQHLRKKLKYLHVPLLALLPLLTFFLVNSDQLEPFNPEILTFIAFNLVVTIIAFVMSLAILRNLRKAFVLTSLLVAFFFLYGHLEDALEGFAINAIKLGPTKVIIVAYIAIVAMVYLALRKSNAAKVRSINKTLTLIALVLTGSTLAQIIPKEISQYQASEKVKKDVLAADSARGQSTDNLPDVYYIVPDSYPRNDILKKTFDFDNSEFIRNLKDRGFFVAEKSNSNYAFTSFSVPSTLNMTYHSLPDPTADDTTFNLKDNKAVVAMKERGYKFINIGTGWGASKRIGEGADIKLEGDAENKSIDVLGLNIKLSEFMIVYTKTTAARSLLDKRIKEGLSNTILDALNAVGEVPDIKDPTFTFVHLYVPHPPFIFDENGPIDSQKLEMTGDIFKDREHFIPQLKFTNKLLIETVDKIIARSERPPIIVLASDHGSATILGHPANWGAPSAETADGIRERMGILNSYYFPDRDYSKLRQDSTPINTLPTILNQYLGGDYETFPNKSYFSNYTKKNVIFDVTELVN